MSARCFHVNDCLKNNDLISTTPALFYEITRALDFENPGMQIRFDTDRHGRLEAIISDESDWRLFETLSQLIVKEFNGVITAQLDGFDQRYWDIQIEGQTLTLHLEHYLGIMLFGYDEQGDALVRKICIFLESISTKEI